MRYPKCNLIGIALATSIAVMLSLSSCESHFIPGQELNIVPDEPVFALAPEYVESEAELVPRFIDSLPTGEGVFRSLNGDLLVGDTLLLGLAPLRGIVVSVVDTATGFMSAPNFIEAVGASTMRLVDSVSVLIVQGTRSSTLTDLRLGGFRLVASGAAPDSLLGIAPDEGEYARSHRTAVERSAPATSLYFFCANPDSLPVRRWVDTVSAAPPPCVLLR